MADGGDRVPLLTGIAEFTSANACETAKAAANAGVDGFMVMPGMVYNSDRRETVNHFRTVAGATDLPIMCYNNPPVYRVDQPPFSPLRSPQRRPQAPHPKSKFLAAHLPGAPGERHR